jgi:hypothetical protein
MVGYGINPAGQTEAWLADLTPPVLGVRLEAGKAVLFWGTNFLNYVLENNGELVGGMWTNDADPRYLVGTEYVVTNTLAAERQFFRLRKP